MLLTVPGKTFIFGEYLALESGPSLLLASGPRFVFKTKEGSFLTDQIHSLSVAGKYISHKPESFKSEQFKFEDPHNSAGGFGASGAQFVFSYVYDQVTQKKSVPDIQTVWETFKKYAQSNDSYSPSGADVVSQMNGGITLFKSDSHLVQKLDWPFKKKSFFIVRTGKKIPTHDHLAELKELPIAPLKTRAEKALKAFVEGDWGEFKQAVQSYYDCLVNYDLVCDYSKKLVHQLNAFKSVELVKSCGALGADTLLIFCDKTNQNLAKENILSMGLEIVSSEIDQAGLEIGADNE